jgi:hypothetical protein
MKKQLSVLIASALAFLASCSEERMLTPVSEPTSGVATVSFTAAIPQEIATYAGGGGNPDTSGQAPHSYETKPQTYASHNGGATNVNAEEYDLRYIIEAWTRDVTPRLAFRAYRIVPQDFNTQSITLDVSLPPQVYDFVFWADFVAQGTTEATAHDADLYYRTNDGKSAAEITADPACDAGLQNVSMLFPDGDAYDVNNDARDAFYKTIEIDLRNGSIAQMVELRRPFGKYRLVGIGRTGYLAMIDTVSLRYDAPSLPTRFNALTGIVDNTTNPLNLSATEFRKKTVKEDVNVKGAIYKDAYVMIYDYIFAPQSPAALTLDMTLKAFSSTGAMTGNARALTNIPVSRNLLTTVIGSFFLPDAHLDVIVSDPFADDTITFYAPDARPLAQEYYACPGTSVWLGFKHIAGVEFYWYAPDAPLNPVAEAKDSLLIAKDSSAVQTWWVEPRIDGFIFPRLRVDLHLSSHCGSQPVEDCFVSGELVWKEDFDSYDNGLTPSSAAYSSVSLPAGYTTYAFGTTDAQLVKEGYYSLIKRGTGSWMLTAFNDDHTSPDNNQTGRMFAANGKGTPDKVYEQTVSGLTPGAPCYFSFWIKANDTKLLWTVYSATDNTVLATFNLPPLTNLAEGVWKSYGFDFIVPPDVTTIYFTIYNNDDILNGNDFCIDDIEVRKCD